jgi:hypothetical protein
MRNVDSNPVVAIGNEMLTLEGLSKTCGLGQQLPPWIDSLMELE